MRKGRRRGILLLLVFIDPRGGPRVEIGFEGLRFGEGVDARTKTCKSFNLSMMLFE
jgi:hypothetical protein